MTFASLQAPFAVGLGAVVGALSRYYLGRWLIDLTGLHDFPVGTLGVNLLGCLAMGTFIALTTPGETLSPAIRLMIATGFLGSLTTFSAYELEIATLLDAEGWHQDLLYWLGSPLLGLACLHGGLTLGRILAEE